MSFSWIDNDRDLKALLDGLMTETRVALDTEFHREKTYFPRLALVQLAWSDGLAIVDPLSCDARMLSQIFGPDHLIVLHAAQQDLDVLSHAIGAIPYRIFDTQVAAGFLGYSTPSLASLVNAELKIALPKGDRLTDWLRRPLTDGQKSYAVSDVEHLFELHDLLTDKLDELGRTQWALDACEELRNRKVGPGDPADAWQKQKDVRALKPRTRGVLASLAEWRERRAMASDIPSRQVLPDLALQGIAQREPVSISELAQSRGVDERHTRGAVGTEILAAVRFGQEHPLEIPVSDSDDVDRHLRPAITLISAWLSEVARVQKIDNALLATRSDILAFIRQDQSARLLTGWRRDLVGSDLKSLLSGELGLSFDGHGGLKMMRGSVSPEVPEQMS
ncbi:ribonuclease D [Actinomycetes bacterium]|nr:ribonuclease D [Actinomycetes bacterium]